jgi:hypothetical protein
MAVLKNAINALDPAPEKTSQLTLLLTLLSELCEQKVNQFTEAIETELRTAGSVENKTVPVTEILAKHKEYRAYIKHDAGKIATEVSSAIKKFIAGTSSSILDGISDLVTTGIEAIIGAGSGSQQEMSSYYIVVQSYAILRFDIRVWCRQIEAKGITEQIETALSVVAFKSSVDVRKITLNTFMVAYQDQLGKIGIPDEKWDEYLSTAEQIFQRLRGDSATQVATQPEIVAPFKAISLREPARLYGSLWD